MIIVNQDRDLILNFENVIGIQRDNKNIGVMFVNSDSLTLGTYKTEERTKEVLKEIILAHSNFETIKNVDENRKELAITICGNNYEYFDTYEMPKE